MTKHEPTLEEFMEGAKPEKKLEHEMLLTQWLIKAAATTVSFHTSGNKKERAEKCKTTDEGAK